MDLEALIVDVATHLTLPGTAGVILVGLWFAVRVVFGAIALRPGVRGDRALKVLQLLMKQPPEKPGSG